MLIKAKPLRDLPENKILDYLDKLTGPGEEAVRVAVLAAIKATLEKMTELQPLSQHTAIEAMEALLKVRDVHGAVAAVPWAELERVLAETLANAASPIVTTVQAGQAVGSALLPATAQVSPDRLAQLAVDYVTRHGGARVTGISESTRGALQQILTDSFLKPQNLDATVRDVTKLLNGQTASRLVGLNSQQADSLLKQMNAWAADPQLSEKRVQQLITRTARKMVKDRARLIAQTEAYEAANAGLLGTWKEASDMGLLRIRFGNFIDEIGPRKGERVTTTRPPLHPRCYCSLRLVAREVFGETYYVPEWVTRVINVCARCAALDGTVAA